jgi:hypothetical protein
LRSNAELVVKQFPAGTDVDTEAGEATALEVVIREEMKIEQTEKT